MQVNSDRIYITQDRVSKMRQQLSQMFVWMQFAQSNNKGQIMIDYILNNGISQHWNFFPQEKFDKIESDLKNLDYKATYQPSTNTYGNRL